MNPSRYETLVVKVVDQTASPAEREELMAWLVDHPEQRADFEAQQALKALTDGWVTRLEHDLRLDAHEQSPGHRGGIALGWALLLACVAILGFGAAWEIWLDPEAPAWLGVGLALGTGGSMVLLVAAIRGRLATQDPYDEVVR